MFTFFWKDLFRHGLAPVSLYEATYPGRLVHFFSTPGSPKPGSNPSAAMAASGLSAPTQEENERMARSFERSFR